MTTKTEVKHLTKEGIEVKVGQVWEDLDKRSSGRRVVVIDIVLNDRLGWHRKAPVMCAVVRSIHSESGKGTKVSISRMHKHSTGFKLIKDA